MLCLRIVLWAVIVVVGNASAHADTLFSKKLDVDGDGSADTVTVTIDGTVAVQHNGTLSTLGKLSTPGWRITAVRVDVKSIGKRAIVLVRAEFLDTGSQGTFSDRVEATAFEWRRRGAVWLFSEIVGPNPSDPDLVTHIELGPGSILRYQTRPGVVRCDQKTSRLQLRKFDFLSRRFRAVSSRPEIPPQTPVLTAHRRVKLPPGLSNKTRARVFRFTAASTDLDGGRPVALDDGDAKTLWSESLGGYGRGEFLTAREKVSTPKIIALRFLPGDTRSMRSFRSGNRLRRLLLVTDRPGSQSIIQLPNDPAGAAWAYQQPYWVLFKKPLQASCVSLIIVDVYFGSARRPPRQGYTAISEIAVLTELDRGGKKTLAKLAADIAGGGRDAANAEHMLGQFPQPAGVSALLATLATVRKKPVQKRRLLLLLARIGDSAAASVLSTALGVTTDDEDFARYSRGLRKMGTGAITALGGLLTSEKAPRRARKQAAALLGDAKGAAAVASLMAACGQGDRALRNRIVKSLAGHASTSIARLADLPRHKQSCSADVWRVISLVAARKKSEVGQDVVDRLAKQFAEPGNSYEIRYRLLQAAAALFDRPAAEKLLTTFLARRDTEPALRQVIVDALPGGTGPLDLLTAAIGDADPGVRMRATKKLAAIEKAAHDKMIIERLQKDKWPVVRREAARVLGNRCQRDTPASALSGAAVADKHVSVQRAALLSLAHCKSPRLGKVLLSIIADQRQDGRLRAKAATLIGKRQHKALATEVLRLFTAERGRAFRSGDAVRVAAVLAKSLGRLGDPVAQKSLLDAAQDPTFPFIQAGAIDALGKLCQPGTRAFLRGFASARDRVNRATRLSLRRCQQ